MNILTVLLASAALAPWQDPSVSAINRLPAHAKPFPAETEQLAIDIAQWRRPKEASRWVQCLDGTWDFRWKRTPASDWEKSGTIRVPSCWQLQGDYDPPRFDCRNPVGLYRTTFTRPWRWWFRRTVIRFEGVSSAFCLRVNGKAVGYSEDSRLPAEFDLTPYLRIFGANELELEVYRHSDGTYLEDKDFWCFSGIFRSVYLVSESKSAPDDLIVETWLSDDLKAGKFTVRDASGRELKVRDVTNPMLWSAEIPNVYMTPMEHKWGWWIFGGTDYYVVPFGFRKIETKEGVLHINGRRARLMGADRREMQPEGGCAVTREDMTRDVRLMRSFNINAVRTGHCPDAPDWYDLCDRSGIMLVPEACAERGTRMVKFYRNHPSVIFWPVDGTNGVGKCGDPARTPPHFEGGFVRNFADQAVWKTDARGKWLSCGGDWGDRPNDANFTCSGLFDALRNPHPVLYEVKYAYRQVLVESFDWATGVMKVRNGYAFTDLEDLDDVVWTAVGADGTETAKGHLADYALAPGETCEFKLEGVTGESVTIRFLRDGAAVAWETFTKPFRPLRPAGGAGAARPPAAGKGAPSFRFNLWRAPTDNDRGWQMPKVCKVWKDATEAQKLPAGVTSDLKVSRLADGASLVDWTLVVPKGLPPIPRVGLTFTVPAKGPEVEYVGLGPWENYADRARAAIFARHRATVGLVSGLADAASGTIAYPEDRLNPDNAIEPGEQGYRTGCRLLKVGEVEVTAVNAPFGFNVWPYPQTELEGRKHQWELKKSDGLYTVNVDAVQMGVGGDNGRGARPHDEFLPGAGTYRLSFIVKGL